MSRRSSHTITISCDRCGHEQTEPFVDYDPQNTRDAYLPAQWGRVTWTFRCIPYIRELCPDCLEHCHVTISKEPQ